MSEMFGTVQNIQKMLLHMSYCWNT